MGFVSDFGTAVGKSIDTAGIADKLFAKILPWAEAKADQLAEKYTPIVIEKLLAMMPTLAATVAKVAIEEAFKGIPQLPNVVLPPVEAMAGQVVQSLATDVTHIPGLSDLINLPELFKGWTEGH